jgi:hypothetical protein
MQVQTEAMNSRPAPKSKYHIPMHDAQRTKQAGSIRHSNVASIQAAVLCLTLEMLQPSKIRIER